MVEGSDLHWFIIRVCSSVYST